MVQRNKGWNSDSVICTLRYGLCGFVITAFFLLFLVFPAGCVDRSGSRDVVQVVSTQDRKAELLKTLDRKFENPQAQYELGRIYHNEGQWLQAEWRYNQALTFTPFFRQAQAAMVRLFVDSRNPEKEKHYSEMYMQQVSASASQSLELALAYQELQLDKYALACYQNALELAPNSANVHRQVGFYYLSRHNEEKAKEHLMLSYQLYPNQPDVARELGLLGIEVKRP